MNVEQISNGLTKLIELELKTAIKKRYDICKENGERNYFRKQYLLDEAIGTLVYDKIEWSTSFENI